MNIKLQSLFTKPTMNSIYVECLLCHEKVDSIDKYLYGHLRSNKHKLAAIRKEQLTKVTEGSS